MAVFGKYDQFPVDLVSGIHDFDTHTINIALSNRAPVQATDATLTTATQIASGNGYATDGKTCTFGSATKITGGVRLVMGDPGVWTGGPAAMAQLQYAIMFNLTSASDSLICNWNYGSAIIVGIGETLTVDLDGTNGIFTILAS